MSTARTRKPRFTSAAARWPPMKPPPPATSTACRPLIKCMHSPHVCPLLRIQSRSEHHITGRKPKMHACPQTPFSLLNLQIFAVIRHVAPLADMVYLLL